jgi:hypothetical protein
MDMRAVPKSGRTNNTDRGRNENKCEEELIKIDGGIDCNSLPNSNTTRFNSVQQ